MKKPFAFLLFSTFLFSDDANIKNLLSEYRESAALHHQTQEEKSGNVIVFSRSDLDKMQAFTLNDVLKTIKLFTLKNTKIGMNSLVKTPYSEATNSSIKLFINSYEINSLTMGTALSQFGKMGLNFIDHIEVYQASNSVSFGGEPGNMTIRMYTKDPSREDATVIQASVDSHAGTRSQAIDAGRIGKYAYLANVEVAKNRYDNQSVNGRELSRDGGRIQAYFNFGVKDDFLIEANLASERDDIFAGFGSSVEGGYLASQNYYAEFTKFFDNDLKFIINNSYEEVRLHNLDSAGIKLYDGTLSNDLFTKIGSKTVGATLQKKFYAGDNTILSGIEMKHKEMFVDELKSGTEAKTPLVGQKSLSVYMFTLEDTYNFNDNHFITLGAKFDMYDNYRDQTTEEIFRFAYVGEFSKEFSLKYFMQKNYNYPIFAQTTFSPLYKPNPDLKSSIGKMMKLELEHKKDNLTLTLGAGFSKSRNGIVFNKTKQMYVNNPDSSDFALFSINANYLFDADNKIILEYFRTSKEGLESSSDNGALVQLFTKVDKFDIYNELVYRNAFVDYNGISMDAGYDYTAGIIYHYSKNLDIKLKGENILNKASMSTIGGVETSAIEKRAILTCEYVF